MIKLTKDALQQILPRAPQPVIDAFAAKQDLLTKAGAGGSAIQSPTENSYPLHHWQRGSR
jgi:hypothetical protein